MPTYPSRLPALALDFVLYTEGIEMKDFRVPRVGYSDHLPLVCDFTPDGRSREARAS
jgi:endonuclease/exonuclease/phosphatase family metal-dependent hydrolase